ncbi:MAG: S-methyl-5'-thioinosine phosphorylase [Gammaproteobacteria bacterium]|nr:S-methyl-5'-thioinosine phosphorylase [Gammaproteobacteria bacterium]
MNRVAIIGGSGLDKLTALVVESAHTVTTIYGTPSGPLLEGTLDGAPILFLPRHGATHGIPPHRINYRANIAALRDFGVEEIFAVTAVGGIGPETGPGRIVIPDQLIDYTSGREHTFYDGIDAKLDHAEFGEPYSATIRTRLIHAAARVGIEVVPHGVYGATQGPRLESAAEIARLQRDGCTLVGMTGMPEAGLAREAGLHYANCALSVNWAAGIGSTPISLVEIGQHLTQGMASVVQLLSAALRTL